MESRHIQERFGFDVGTGGFLVEESAVEEHWRSLVLFGENTTSYKFALAKALIEVAAEGHDFVPLRTLALPFSRHICAHLGLQDVQARGKKMNGGAYLNACRFYNAEKISEDELIETTARTGFRYVLDRFHHLAGYDELTPFFVRESQNKIKGIHLTDAMFDMTQGSQGGVLIGEAEARWNLVEDAWASREDAWTPILFDSPSEQLVRALTGKRRRIADVRPTLNGYQKGHCFYCFGRIDIVDGVGETECDVDHFLPHALLAKGYPYDLDAVWNLVLACSRCNRGEKGKFANIPHRKFLQRLSNRNNFFIFSHHPLRETLLAQTGASHRERAAFLTNAYSKALEMEGGVAGLLTQWQPSMEERPLF